MKIFLICPVGSADWGLLYCYKNAFVSLGHEVRLDSVEHRRSFTRKIYLKIESYFKHRSAEKVRAPHLLSIAKKFQPDLVICIKCEALAEGTLKDMKRMTSAKFINIYSDNPFVIPGTNAVSMAKQLACYDLVCTFSQAYIPVFYQLGANNVRWLPFAYDPTTAKSLNQPVSQKYKVTYLGSWGPLQEQWLEPLASLGLNIFGWGWDHARRGSPLQACWRRGVGIGKDMHGVIHDSKVVVNFIRAEHGCAHSMKTFEIPACGGLMVTNRTKEQELFFEDGKEALFFNTPQELREQIKYLLDSSQERERIRMAGMRVAQQHTYVQRVSVLLNYLQTGEWSDVKWTS